MNVESVRRLLAHLSDDIILNIFFDVAPVREYVIEVSEYFVSDLINQKDYLRNLVYIGIALSFSDLGPIKDSLSLMTHSKWDDAH
jgi:5-carboxymethyl-2-hydroxymuconate isomerase